MLVAGGRATQQINERLWGSCGAPPHPHKPGKADERAGFMCVCITFPSPGATFGYVIMINTDVATSPYALASILTTVAFVCGVWGFSLLKLGVFVSPLMAPAPPGSPLHACPDSADVLKQSSLVALLWVLPALAGCMRPSSAVAV